MRFRKKPVMVEASVIHTLAEWLMILAEERIRGHLIDNGAEAKVWIEDHPWSDRQQQVIDGEKM